MEWQPIETAPRNGDYIYIMLGDGSVCDAWFSRGEWSESTPMGPAEYSGDAWVCCDDRFNIEVTDMGEHGYDDGEAVLWLPTSSLPGPTK